MATSGKFNAIETVTNKSKRRRTLSYLRFLYAKFLYLQKWKKKLIRNQKPLPPFIYVSNISIKSLFSINEYPLSENRSLSDDMVRIK